MSSPRTAAHERCCYALPFLALPIFLCTVPVLTVWLGEASRHFQARNKVGFTDAINTLTTIPTCLSRHQVTDYPPTPLKRAQQASLHLSKHLNASASAICRQQIQMQAHADIYPSLSATNGNELVPFTPQQAISPFFDHHAMNPSFMHVPMTIPPLVGFPRRLEVVAFLTSSLLFLRRGRWR